MFRTLFLFFIIIPIIEIAVLIQVGDWLGLWPTLSIVIITAWLGAKNVRQQGLATMNSVQVKMAQGQLPSDEIVAGVLLLIAGVLLVTPGFVTDIFGLSLLIPSVRQNIIKTVQKHLVVSQQRQYHSGFSGYSESSSGSYQQEIRGDQDRKGQTLDGEFERKD